MTTHPGQPDAPPGGDPGPPDGGDAPMRDPGPPPGVDPGPPSGAEGDDPNALPKLTRDDLAYFWPYLQPDRGKVILALLTMIFQAAAPVAMGLLPWWLSLYWDQGLVHMLALGLVVLLALNVLTMGVQVAGTYLISSSAEGFVRRVALAIFRKIGALPSQEISSQSIGNFAQRITGDLMRIQDLIAPGLLRGAVDALQMVFMFIALFMMGPLYAAVVVLTLPLLVWGVVRFNRRVTTYARQDQLQHQVIMTRFIESIGGYRDLVASGRFGRAAERFDDELQKRERIAVTTSMWNVGASLVPLAGFLALVFVYYFMSIYDESVVGNEQMLGKVISFASLIAMARGPVLNLFQLYTESALSAPSLFEVRRLLDAPTLQDRETVRVPKSNAITFEHVGFSYSPDQPPVLGDMSFTIDAGTFVGIVGESGGGKTTMFHLLVRLLEPTHGRILLGDVPLEDISLLDLREVVGFIPQNPFIFDGTIRENILLGAPPDQVSDEDLQRAVQLARLEALLTKRARDGGLDAQVGSAGSTLSGGERQRVALARIFLRDPRVIVCDEYTANVDTGTARLIHETLLERFADKTRIVVTHQLAAIRGADQIFVLDKGGIADRGAHEDLIARGGLYKSMWEVQRLG